MYQIIAYDSPTDDKQHLVYDQPMKQHISDGKLELLESEIDRLTLTVNQANYLFGNVRPLQTHIEVYQDNKLLFRGRCLDLTREMKDSGQFAQSFVFESIQNYLQDTSQRWAKINNMSIKAFFTKLIEVHNAQVPKYKRFVVRNVDVTNSTDNAYYYIEDGATTWDTIKDKLVSRLGGFIRVEYVNGVNYIDYLKDPGKDYPNDTPIRIGKNLQSASVQIDPAEVITQLVPLGATIENDSPNADPDTTVSQPRISIESVNDGKDYLDIPDLQKEFGVIRKSVLWDDVHEPKILLTKAKQWIQQQVSAKESWTINALEIPDERFETFKVSNRYLFDNVFVAENQLLRIAKKTIDFAHPHKSELTIADKPTSLSNYQLDNINAIKVMQGLKSQVDNYNGQIVILKKQSKEMNELISNQQKTIDEIKQESKAKRIAIVGDSYSTYLGWNPEGNEVWFDGVKNDVTNVNQTWWYQVITALSGVLFLNESYSGSTIANSGRDGTDTTATSLLTRGLNKFGSNLNLKDRPDIIFVYGGLNDTWQKVPVGTAKYSDWTEDDLKETLPAFSKLLNDLIEYNPNAKIVTLCSNLLLSELSLGMNEVAKHYKATNILLPDLDLLNSHPTQMGMKQISNKVISSI